MVFTDPRFLIHLYLNENEQWQLYEATIQDASYGKKDSTRCISPSKGTDNIQLTQCMGDLVFHLHMLYKFLQWDWNWRQYRISFVKGKQPFLHMQTANIQVSQNLCCLLTSSVGQEEPSVMYPTGTWLKIPLDLLKDWACTLKHWQYGSSEWPFYSHKTSTRA